MGDVIDFRQRRLERLVPDLARRLRESDGKVSEPIEDLAVDVETWRAAARRAGRSLGWSIRTRVRDGRVSLVDNRHDHQRSRGRDAVSGRLTRPARTRGLGSGDDED